MKNHLDDDNQRNSIHRYYHTYYLKRTKEGLPYKKAVLAMAHKLIRVIYAMLTQWEFFCLQLNS